MQRILFLLLLVLLAGVAPLAARDGEGLRPKVAGGRQGSVERSEWEVVFDDAITDEDYARQMDYFGIEIGAVSKNGKIELIAKVSQTKPERRVNYVDREYRLWIGWKSGSMHAADRRLLRKAGINSQDKEMMHYFSPALQKQMEELETRYAGRKRDDIVRTQFQIRPKAKGSGYEFVVIEQDPPKETKDRPAAAASQNRPAEP